MSFEIEQPQLDGETYVKVCNAHTDRETWLQARRCVIGASESRILLGEGYASETPLTLYLSKVDPEPEEHTLERLTLGNELEAAIARTWSKHYSKIEVVPCGELIASIANPFIGATCDFLTLDGDPVEIKNCGEYTKKDWAEGLPRKFFLQVQHQLFVTRRKKGYLVALIGGNEIVWDEIEADRDTMMAIESACRDFWENHVRPQVPPDVTASDEGKTLGRAYSMPDAPMEVSVPDAEAIELDGEVERLSEEIKTLEAVKALRKNQMRQLIHRAAPGVEIDEADKGKWIAKGIPKAGLYAHLGNGVRYALKGIEMPGRTQVVKAHTQYRMTRSGAK